MELAADEHRSYAPSSSYNITGPSSPIPTTPPSPLRLVMGVIARDEDTLLSLLNTELEGDKDEEEDDGELLDDSSTPPTCRSRRGTRTAMIFLVMLLFVASTLWWSCVTVLPGAVAVDMTSSLVVSISSKRNVGFLPPRTTLSKYPAP
eukprot:TRINITY_DN9469_c0_g2_i1.p2 TRINITY_DN9469_c0_g2~~TRINITY_DN9469_c0_g2_i1.p2  ORF type:complete len:148 (-),score=0.86 TRINITY_DN9469_c0_g2_i1:479-922(-)